MLILGITTSGAESEIALWRDGAVVDERVFGGARACVEGLIPAITAAMAEKGLKLADADLFAVDRGPGGLTGIKIGIVAARTLAQVFMKPIVGVSPLQAAACAAPPDVKNIFVVTNCTAKEVFTGMYTRGAEGAIPDEVGADRLDTPESAAKRIEEFAGAGDVYLTGAAVERLPVELLSSGRIILAPAEMRRPKAGWVCAIGSGRAPAEWRELQANYLCLSYAERAAGG